MRRAKPILKRRDGSVGEVLELLAKVPLEFVFALIRLLKSVFIKGSHFSSLFIFDVIVIMLDDGIETRVATKTIQGYDEKKYKGEMIKIRKSIIQCTLQKLS